MHCADSLASVSAVKRYLPNRSCRRAAAPRSTESVLRVLGNVLAASDRVRPEADIHQRCRSGKARRLRAKSPIPPMFVLSTIAHPTGLSAERILRMLAAHNRLALTRSATDRALRET